MDLLHRKLGFAPGMAMEEPSCRWVPLELSLSIVHYGARQNFIYARRLSSDLRFLNVGCRGQLCSYRLLLLLR